MKSIKSLYLVWILAFIVLVVITLKYRGEFTEFYGIAETREIVVNSENAVEIKKIHVVPGQAVTKGDLLVELARPELTKKINEISHKLEELKVQKVANTDALQSRIDELKAKKTSTISKINYRLKQLQAQYTINKELSSELKSLEKDVKKNNVGSPIQIEIESLEQALTLSVNPIEIRIDMLENELNALKNPIDIQIERLKTELNLLLEEKNKLYIFAQVTGLIGSVGCKAGQQITPFSPILTLHTRNPHYVKGFIHEKAYTEVSVGKKVKIISLADPDYKLTGEIVGVGGRIIEYPGRLRTMLGLKVYGREVRVKIPEENNLLLGEKVIVSVRYAEQSNVGIARYNSLLKNTDAKENAKTVPEKNDDAEITDIKVNKSLNNITNIEASGIIYLRDLKKYLVISDTTRDNRLVFYVMDGQGKIEDEIYIQGLQKIDDMEAITASDDGNIYVVCSQSYDKNGTLPDERKLLIRIKRDIIFLEPDKQVYLYDLLKEAAEKDKKAEWVQFITSGGDDFAIDVEGMFCHENSIYLGFKKPLKNSRAVVLKIADADRMFEENMLDAKNVELWREFDLKDAVFGNPTGISDLYFHENRVYILSYGKVKTSGQKKKTGNLWVYDIAGDKLSHLRRLENLKPEGITFNPDENVFLITFDNGKKQPSKVMRLKLSD